MKKSIWLILTVALTLGVSAEMVTPEMAKTAATAWAGARKNVPFGAGAYANGDVHTETDPTNSTITLWHQVPMSNGGMLVVAPVTEIEPIVMALDNNPGELPQRHPLRAVLTKDMRRRLQFLDLYGKKPAPQPGIMMVAAAAPASASAVSSPSPVAKEWGDANNAKWSRLTTPRPVIMKAVLGMPEIDTEISVVKGFEKGGALTHWDQGKYNNAPLYNLYTPENAVCGCVATACAALAQFYGTTNALEFSAECSMDGVKGTYSTKAGAIDWNILPENWGGTNAAITATEALTAEQQDLIGRVAYNAGVGVKMQWTSEESGAYTTDIADALKNVFGFKNARAVRLDDAANPDQKQLEKLIYNQVRAGVPVGMSIDGHAVVAVGYGIDDDGVERVRVFMGWSGDGDGWYALPKIDTRATVGGGNYLSEIVAAVITMISYDDDDIVPVVGHVSLSGAQLEVPALRRDIFASDLGYFATRVPADMVPADCKLTCYGKEATFEIGADALDSEEASVLADALPDAFEFSLLNSTVAYSLERAKLLARREGKAILRVSGTSNEEDTKAVLDYIYYLDQTDPDFANQFVYLFSERSSSAGDGAEVSYGVYLPIALNVDDRWVARNGALSYGYAGIDAFSEEYHSTTTFAPIDEEPEIVTNDVDAAWEIQSSIKDSLDAVLESGWKCFTENTSDISVIVTTLCEEEFEIEKEVAAISSSSDSNPCGVYENCFTAGTVTFLCGSELTNNTAGVVYECKGWKLLKKVTDPLTDEVGNQVLESGEGPVATFNVNDGDRFVLAWNLAKKAVKVEVTCSDDRGTLNAADLVTPGTGWYPYGTPVMFTAAPETPDRKGKSRFEYFSDVDSAVELPPFSYVVPMEKPVEVEAKYRRGGELKSVPEVDGTCAVTVNNYVWNVDDRSVSPATGGNVPALVVCTSAGAVEIANGATGDVPAAKNVAYMPAAMSYVAADGTVMEFYGVMDGVDVMLDEPQPFKADFSSDETRTIVFAWKSVSASDDEGGSDDPTPAPPTTFAIEWDDALSVLNASNFSTNLLTKAQLDKFGITLETITVSAPKGFKAKLAYDADGNVKAELDLDEEVLKPRASDGVSSPLTILSNGDGSVTVKADVANGVRGFWYTLYGTDDLALAAWTPVTSGYFAGSPREQADGAEVDQMVTVSIDINPDRTKRFFKLVVTPPESGE